MYIEKQQKKITQIDNDIKDVKDAMASNDKSGCKPDSILKQRRSQKQACKQRENQRKLAEK